MHLKLLANCALAAVFLTACNNDPAPTATETIAPAASEQAAPPVEPTAGAVPAGNAAPEVETAAPAAIEAEDETDALEAAARELIEDAIEEVVTNAAESDVGAAIPTVPEVPDVPEIPDTGVTIP